MIFLRGGFQEIATDISSLNLFHIFLACSLLPSTTAEFRAGFSSDLPKPNLDFPLPSQAYTHPKAFPPIPILLQNLQDQFSFYFISFYLEKLILVYPAVQFHFAASEPKISP